MNLYIAFLRGVNPGGKNKIHMEELKTYLENNVFGAVITYLNSGNVLFSSDQNGREELASQIESMIKVKFGFDIPVFVILRQDLEDILQNAPAWWGAGREGIYDNLIFIMPPAVFSQVLDEIGTPREGLEQIQNYKEAIFWSFSRKDYQKTNWWPKTASAAISRKLTNRTPYPVSYMDGMCPLLPSI